ncbi:MAG: dTDP-4-dehydrorhamnose 3,5-epimerase [Hyphomonas sp.]|uniref:dTDP-4-dehydrorhamnose 3,5-epimerase n=1 Tax=Hyphomonas sp. TaxID=87 RepID=UPI003528F302
MRFKDTSLRDAKFIELEPFGDPRGAFARTFCEKEFAANGLETQYVQHSFSVSRSKGTLRGMHMQRAPYLEEKLVRVTRGAIYDVIVDVRPESPTYLKHEGFELSAECRCQLYVPKGFLHGFLTLQDDTEVLYLISEFYQPGQDRGARYDDPAFGIHWPGDIAVIADKDLNWPPFPIG